MQGFYPSLIFRSFQLWLFRFHLGRRRVEPFFKNESPLYVNSIAVDTLGNIYTLARINREGRTVTDLIKINLIA